MGSQFMLTHWARLLRVALWSLRSNKSSSSYTAASLRANVSSPMRTFSLVRRIGTSGFGRGCSSKKNSSPYIVNTYNPKKKSQIKLNCSKSVIFVWIILMLITVISTFLFYTLLWYCWDMLILLLFKYRWLEYHYHAWTLSAWNDAKTVHRITYNWYWCCLSIYHVNVFTGICLECRKTSGEYLNNIIKNYGLFYYYINSLARVDPQPANLKNCETLGIRRGYIGTYCTIFFTTQIHSGG